MHTEVLSRFNLPWLPISALAIFLGCFIIFLLWTLKKDRKSFFESTSQMPLTDGVKHERK